VTPGRNTGQAGEGSGSASEAEVPALPNPDWLGLARSRGQVMGLAD